MMPTSNAPAPDPAHERPGLSWSGTVDYGPGPLHAPTSLEQLQALVARSDRLRALGTRHSFSEVAVSDAEQ
jgi:xylitol oxidase